MICQFPSYILFTLHACMFIFFGETPLVKPWPRVLFSSLIEPSLKHFHHCFLAAPFLLLLLPTFDTFNTLVSARPED